MVLGIDLNQKTAAIHFLAGVTLLGKISHGPDGNDAFAPPTISRAFPET
jgi:hypothetical protein